MDDVTRQAAVAEMQRLGYPLTGDNLSRMMLKMQTGADMAPSDIARQTGAVGDMNIQGGGYTADEFDKLNGRVQQPRVQQLSTSTAKQPPTPRARPDAPSANSPEFGAPTITDGQATKQADSGEGDSSAWTNLLTTLFGTALAIGGGMAGRRLGRPNIPADPLALPAPLKMLPAPQRMIEQQPVNPNQLPTVLPTPRSNPSNTPPSITPENEQTLMRQVQSRKLRGTAGAKADATNSALKETRGELKKRSDDKKLDRDREDDMKGKQ